MKNGDLKIVRVYTQDGKQVAFDVQNATGTQRVDKATVVGAIKNGHSYVNATVTSSGVVRVDANVPRLPMQRNKLKVQAILYSPYREREGALGALVKCGNAVKACTYDEFCSTVNNYECDLDDREAVVCFNPRKSFKNGYKYIDISKKEFLKSKVYKMSTPALKELVYSHYPNPDNPEIKYPLDFMIFGERVKVGYYDKPNNYKPVDMRFTRVNDKSELTENDDYYYFTVGWTTYYTKVEFNRVANDDYMAIVMIQVIEQFYKDLAARLEAYLFVNLGGCVLLQKTLPTSNYQHISHLLGDRGSYGILIHNAALPFDAIGASSDCFGNTVFRTKYAFDKIQAAYCNCIRLINDIVTGK